MQKLAPVFPARPQRAGFRLRAPGLTLPKSGANQGYGGVAGRFFYRRHAKSGLGGRLGGPSGDALITSRNMHLYNTGATLIPAVCIQ